MNIMDLFITLNKNIKITKIYIVRTCISLWSKWQFISVNKYIHCSCDDIAFLFNYISWEGWIIWEQYNYKLLKYLNSHSPSLVTSCHSVWIHYQRILEQLLNVTKIFRLSFLSIIISQMLLQLQIRSGMISTQVNHRMTRNMTRQVNSIPPNRIHLSPSDRFSICLITVLDNPSTLATSSIFFRKPCNV